MTGAPVLPVQIAGGPTDRALHRMATLGLDELDAVAALQTRRDRKYLVAADRLPSVLGALDGEVRVLEIGGRRWFPYRSTYFDTPDLHCYLQAARRRPNRFKVRTRSYLATGTCWVELKARDQRGQTVKERIEHPADAEAVLTPPARSFLSGHDHVRDHVDVLRPSLVTNYHRATLHCGQRVTVDSGLRCTLPDGDAVPLGELGDLLIVETKSPGRGPGPVDRALWRCGIRPCVISKYAVGTAAAWPSLPSNTWHRVLRRHVDPTRPGGRS